MAGKKRKNLHKHKQYKRFARYRCCNCFSKACPSIQDSQHVCSKLIIYSYDIFLDIYIYYILNIFVTSKVSDNI